MNNQKNSGYDPTYFGPPGNYNQNKNKSQNYSTNNQSQQTQSDVYPQYNPSQNTNQNNFKQNQNNQSQPGVYPQYNASEQDYRQQGNPSVAPGMHSYGNENYGMSTGLLAQMATVMQGVYGLMTLGLSLTALTAFLSATFMTRVVMSNMFFVFMLIEIGLVWGISLGINKMSAATAKALFVVYSVVNGLTLSVIFLAYTKTSIASCFAVTAIMFGVMSIIGFTTKKNLSSLGGYLLMALIGVIIASIVNLFILNSAFSFFISVITILIFIGLTAYDTQKIKKMLSYSGSSPEMVGKVTVIGALNLYLDFINIFLHLLRIVGRRR